MSCELDTTSDLWTGDLVWLHGVGEFELMACGIVLVAILNVALPNMFGWLLELDVLATSKVISEQAETCDNVH